MPLPAAPNRAPGPCPGEDSAARAILRPMRGSRALRTAAAALGLAAVLAAPLPGATKKKRRKASTPTPTATPTPTPPPPTPTPGLRKAAGSCVRYEAGAYVILSEVGRPGRAFRIDSGTDITARPRRGARLRILYLETPEGPLARKIMPGPTEEKPGD